ncbi:MAG: hypothetical protein ACE5HB_01600 [Terriglobia bacterium]
MMRVRHQARWLALVLLGALALAAASPWARAEDKKVRLTLKLVAAETGKPIKNAIVYVKFKESRFLRKDKKREWSLKTNREGVAVFPLLPEGQVLVQIVIKGWKTYGRFHDITSPKQSLTIELKKARKWY